MALWEILSLSCLSRDTGGVNVKDLKSRLKYLPVTGQDSPGHRNDEKAWLTDQMVDDATARVVASKKKKGSAVIQPEHMMRLIADPSLRHTNEGGYLALVSLAEAETIRRILHLRGKDQAVVEVANSSMALPAPAQHRRLLDTDGRFPRLPGPTCVPMMQRGQQLLHFFDGELCFTFAQQLMLLHSLAPSFTHERQAFFEAVIALRRRQQLQSDDALVTNMLQFQSVAELAFTVSGLNAAPCLT